MSFSPKRIPSTTFWLLSLILFLSFASPADAGSWEHSFFAGTQYPLKVVYLQGGQPGPTVMVQGGIQGDETAGYITAQLLSQGKVLRGNLIVLPRANVPSINLRKRQINVDMNRRFDQNYNRFYEDRVARVIRYLLNQADAFIHLHEGSGFYNPTYVDNLRNPKRYGQSFIVDTLAYNQIDLAGTVAPVLDELNNHIGMSDYKFRLFNTRTFDQGTNYPEMRKSLTCYALAEHNIPAVAVEVSKSIIQIDWKVRQQLTATIMLLHRLGVEVVPPEFTDEDVQAYARKGVTVMVNGRTLGKDKVINLAPGSTLAVKQVSAGPTEFAPELALFASDRPGVNLINARRMVLEQFSELELRSDGRKVAEAQVRWTGRLPNAPGDDTPVFVCWLNGNPIFVREGETLHAVLGDQLILEGIWGSDLKEVVNLKGFVAIPWANNGQDLGWEIILDPDNFMSKYALEEDRSSGTLFRVVRETPGVPRSTFYVEILPRTVLALRLGDERGQNLLIPWISGGSYRLPEGDYVFESAWSNGPDDKLVALAGDVPLEKGRSFRVDYTRPLKLTVRQATTFGDIGSMTFTAGGLASRETRAQ
ncbi:M14/M99 family metallopeptidase [Desulfovibrio sp. Fe33]|uniref:M14/M99 family metallopeptidase n=1 Tax=Desulfovibrio sp. Fe33 TaxID=3020842 RepID=UPI00234C9614|nr:M14/M99 family metallopeptidase [Desulfovibrio sp. Fe33]